jgi:hypothetical protein
MSAKSSPVNTVSAGRHCSHAHNIPPARQKEVEILNIFREQNFNSFISLILAIYVLFIEEKIFYIGNSVFHVYLVISGY